MCNPDDIDPNFDIDLHLNSKVAVAEDLASTILSMIKASSCEAFHTATEVRLINDSDVVTANIASM